MSFTALPWSVSDGLGQVHHDEDPEDVEGSFLGDEPQVQQYAAPPW